MFGVRSLPIRPLMVYVMQQEHLKHTMAMGSSSQEANVETFHYVLIFGLEWNSLVTVKEELVWKVPLP